MLENLVNEFNLKSLFLNRSFFPTDSFPETHRNFLQRVGDFSSGTPNYSEFSGSFTFQ